MALNDFLIQQDDVDATIAAIVNQIKICRKQMAETHRVVAQLIFQNPKAVSPGAIIKRLGTDAGSLFRLGDLNDETIVDATKLIGDNAEFDLPGIPRPYKLIINADGTANIVVDDGTATDGPPPAPTATQATTTSTATAPQPAARVALRPANVPTGRVAPTRPIPAPRPQGK